MRGPGAGTGKAGRRGRGGAIRRALALAGATAIFAGLAGGSAAAEPWGFEQVSPFDKGPGTVAGFSTFTAAPDGETFLYTAIGSFSEVPSKSVPIFTRYYAQRGEDRWHSVPVDPPYDLRKDGVFIQFPTMATLRTSENLRYSFISTLRALTPGATQGGSNHYIQDNRTGDLTLVMTGSDPRETEVLTGLQGQTGVYWVAPDGKAALFNRTYDEGESKAGLYQWTAEEGLERIPERKVTGFVVDAFQLESERARGVGEQRRFQAIRRLIDGDPVAASQLDFDIEQYHLGVVAWGGDTDQAIRDLAGSLGRISLTVGALNGTRWGWISGTRPLDGAAERRLAAYEPPPGAGIAIGIEGFGEAGFRTTNGQALRARWVARRLGLSVARYSEVAIEALASANRQEARSFVRHELRGIDDDSTSSTRIRETILAYFAAEQNAASAAAALGIHQQTVANRLRAAEERLGHPVVSRRVELETALRLRACLDG